MELKLIGILNLISISMKHKYSSQAEEDQTCAEVESE